jgi:MerR family copper efflux transcriptional regulator
MTANETVLTIGQLARGAGVGVPTIRYYERRGLLVAPHRRGSGYREYPADNVRRVRFIRHAQGLGFSLKEIAELLALSTDPASTCANVRQKAAQRLMDIEAKLASLTRIRNVLIELMQACPGDGPIESCPILLALDEANASER